MTLRFPAVLVLATGAALALGACSRANPTQPWPAITDPVVFTDQSGANVGFQAFLGSKLDALSIDAVEKHAGTASLKFTVPNPGDPTGGYAGGAFVTSQARNLTAYNALSFWVKASRAVALETAGLGNDNTGTSRYDAKRSGVPMTTSWTRVLVPIPLASKLVKEKGLFYLAEGPQTGAGLTFWVDDVEFVQDATITNPRPILTNQTINAFAGTTFPLPANATRTIFSVAGQDQAVTHSAAYFTFTSSNPAVATITDGVIRVLGDGTASITATLGGVPATGTVTVNAAAPPSTPAPTPTHAASDVISLFSNAYVNRVVDTWSATWDLADVADLTIAGNPTKVYTNLTYAGIEFGTQPIDATAMTHLHLDVWVPSGTAFKVKLVDFGANGIFGGGDDSEHELTFTAATTPALALGAWVPLEIPLAGFTNLAGRAHLAQIVLAGDTRTVFLDNLYFHR